MKKYLIALLCTASTMALAQNAKEMDLTDLKVDAKELIGKQVLVKASIQQMGDMSLLKSDPLDMAPVWADAGKLPRDDRKKLASGCQMVLCSGKFQGTMVKGPMGPTLRLEKVDWR